jgi:S1-C subfamily serine protease
LRSTSALFKGVRRRLSGLGARCAILFASIASVATALPAQAAGGALDLDAVLAPVIALEARIPEHARTASSLGTVRGGTGVVIDAAGLVLTIGYLILEAGSVDLLPEGLSGPRLPADVVAWDQNTGLGLGRSRVPLDIAPMPLGESAALRAGDAAIAASWEGSAGMIPAVVVERRVYTGYWEYLLDDALYVAPIHPSFPGAALIGLDGRLAGIGGFALTDSVDEDEVVGTVFVPVDALKPVLADLLLDGRSPPPRPWLGLYCEEFAGGLRVRRLPAEGPASRAGIRLQDRLLTVSGTPVTTLNSFYRTLWSTARPGDRVALELRRGEESISVEVEAIDRYQYLRLDSSTP